MDAKDRLIVALDADTAEKAMALAAGLKDRVGAFKIGFELFSSCGPSIVREISKLGNRIFLDLKFHDIPNTVLKAAVSVTRLGVFMFNVHALGGYDMMKKTAEAVSAEAARLKTARPKILAVTILTSMDQRSLRGVGINESVDNEVVRLAELARSASLDGVVASPSEAALIRKACGKDFIIVTPGVRPSWSEALDQRRIATPKDAIAGGADYIVVGRPITGAADPSEAADRILKEMNI